MATNPEKLELGRQHLAAGRRFASKTLTRWKPDWESAFQSFDQATKALQIAGEGAKPDLLQAHLLLAQAAEKTDSPRRAATALEKAAKLAETLEGSEDPLPLWENAAYMHRTDRNPDAAARAYMKAAEVAAASNPSRAAGYFLSAAEIVEDEERGVVNDTVFRKGVDFCAKHALLEPALDLLERQQSMYEAHVDTFRDYLRRNFLGQVLILCHMAMPERAAERLGQFNSSEFVDFQGSAEERTASAILSAIERLDNDALSTALSSQDLKLALSNDLIKLAKKLEVEHRPQGAGGAAEEGPADDLDFS